MTKGEKLYEKNNSTSEKDLLTLLVYAVRYHLYLEGTRPRAGPPSISGRRRNHRRRIRLQLRLLVHPAYQPPADEHGGAAGVPKNVVMPQRAIALLRGIQKVRTKN